MAMIIYWSSYQVVSYKTWRERRSFHFQSCGAIEVSTHLNNLNQLSFSHNFLSLSFVLAGFIVIASVNTQEHI
jgi:hypothetical protein